MFINEIKKASLLFPAGGLLYLAIELLWRGYTHWTMFILGGFCFIFIGLINEIIPWNMPLLMQGVVGSVYITSIELIFGLVLNVVFELNIWDYSNMPFNFMGQICLAFSFLWVGLSIVAILIDDFLRHIWFNEEKPHYKII